METSEILRRVQQMHNGDTRPALTLRDYAIATDSEGSAVVERAYAFLREADWVLYLAIILSEAEERS